MATRAKPRERSRRRARILAEVLSEGREALRGQAARHAPSPADAEDALQEACLQFLRYYDGRSGEGALRWLAVCVKHRAWEIAARRRARAGLGEISATDAYDPDGRLLCVLSERPGPAERAERDLAVASFTLALKRLKPDHRTALLLLGLGYTYTEIQENQGWSRAKVNRCLAEGRAALRARQREQAW